MEKILVLGAMPEGAGPQDCFAAGPWCFAGREDLFPGWEDRFVFAPEPLRDPACLEFCAQRALATYVGVLPALAAALRPAGGLPPAYWETLLAPWGVDVARQIVERWTRVTAMIALWGGLPLRVPLLPANCSFSFATGHDFTLYGALGTAFNHWLLSRLLEAVWPGAWQKEILPPVSERHGHDKESRRVKERLRQGARRLVLSLPSPPLKGMSLLQSLRFSLALLHKSRIEDHSSPPDAVFEGARPRCDLPLPALPVFLAALPRSLRELKHPAKLRVTRAPRLRVASIQSYEDEKYLQRLAIWRGRGHRLVYAQHGAGYGQIRTGCMAPAVEYCQHAFITWGWRKHGGMRGNFIPLPYPQLARIAEGHRGGGEDILFVGTEMPLFPYRLDAWPTPLQILEYRRAKRRFFTACAMICAGAACTVPIFPCRAPSGTRTGFCRNSRKCACARATLPDGCFPAVCLFLTTRAPPCWKPWRPMFPWCRTGRARPGMARGKAKSCSTALRRPAYGIPRRRRRPARWSASLTILSFGGKMIPCGSRAADIAPNMP